MLCVRVCVSVSVYVRVCGGVKIYSRHCVFYTTFVRDTYIHNL